ncbi:bifunctional folylpolyglutamate synthase/dihydrofolate synthase [Thermoproteota archaeon]
MNPFCQFIPKAEKNPAGCVKPNLERESHYTDMPKVEMISSDTINTDIKRNDAYQHVIKSLSELVYSRGIHYELNGFKNMLLKLNNPEKLKSKLIHIAGTNGKGSTLNYLSAGLNAVGFSVGRYTSPHLESYTERIQINGTPISEHEFSNLFYTLPQSDLCMTEFEALTAMAFLYFKENKPDFVIFETGLGGAKDATNVIQPDLCIITRIDKEHQAILGDTLAKIAHEKAGIIKPDTPVITIQQSPEAMNVICQRASELNAPLTIVDPVKVPDTYKMTGTFQAENLSLAKAALKHLGIYETNAIEQALSQAFLWGRYQKIRIAPNTIPGMLKNCGETVKCVSSNTITAPLKNDSTTIIIDSAHNPAGIHALLESLKRDYGETGTRMDFLVGIRKIKNYKEMLTQIADAAHQIYFCDYEPGPSVSYNEALHSMGEKKDKLKQIWVKDLEALFYKPQQILIITGSIYFLGMIKPYIDQHMADHK